MIFLITKKIIKLRTINNNNNKDLAWKIKQIKKIMIKLASYLLLINETLQVAVNK